ncbi:restriction endonuclease [Streptomyces sp. NPDC088817]|uniref:restriction endonuclease n=1 Tax=unclassified Streptomyces TaxID=2593676 RepID=UPI0036EBA2E9
MNSLRHDPRTSVALSGSGWLAKSPQGDQLLTYLAPGEQVDLLFTTLRYQGALTRQRLFLWRGTFKMTHLELRRPLLLLGRHGNLAETVVLAGPEGPIELKSLSARVARTLIDATSKGDGDAPTIHMHGPHSDESATPGEESTGSMRTRLPPPAEPMRVQESGFRPRSIQTWQDAELAAVDHMRSMGFFDARTTAAGADGGIDVIADHAVAQVKHHSQPISVGPVRELRGVADLGQHLLFYSSGGYTDKACEFAEERDIALFSILPSGDILPLNTTARNLSARLGATSGWSSAPDTRTLQRAADLAAQRETVHKQIRRILARTNERRALPSNRYTKDTIKALETAHKLAEQATSLLRKSQADFQTHGMRRRLVAMADEKAREASLKLGMRP